MSDLSYFCVQTKYGLNFGCIQFLSSRVDSLKMAVRTPHAVATTDLSELLDTKQRLPSRSRKP